ncbi:DUF4160 domain-containing protein [Cellulosimicrobium arenosum]|uniref:DUF4160 domain-containing protein n=1 Tax=Cellulosimicrobium arenosum TaxID=2708133 RepID=A0A927IZ93_9MICO|nr:DUF4160 domain-containing protein [Cellulosimicrobium arenosum]MBD8078339.1 DUF4160 domain-containing protein [Cellulosimicrobium arenosum]
MKDDDLTPYERAWRNPGEPVGWELADSEGRIEADDVLGRLVNMALYEFGETDGDWPISFDDDGFIRTLTAEGKRFDGGISIHVWPNDHPPPHVHILKRSEPDGQGVKINLKTGESEGDLPSWASQKQLKKMRALVVKHHELFANWWQKHHGGAVVVLLS